MFCFCSPDPEAAAFNSLVFMLTALLGFVAWRRVSLLIKRISDMEREVDYLHMQAINAESSMTTALSLARTALSVNSPKKLDAQKA